MLQERDALCAKAYRPAACVSAARPRTAGCAGKARCAFSTPGCWRNSSKGFVPVGATGKPWPMAPASAGGAIRMTIDRLCKIDQSSVRWRWLAEEPPRRRHRFERPATAGTLALSGSPVATGFDAAAADLERAADGMGDRADWLALRSGPGANDLAAGAGIHQVETLLE